MKTSSSKTTALSTLLVEFGDVLAGPSPITDTKGETKPSRYAAFRKAFREQMTVVGALILRDMRTRFGRTHLGFVIAILWPLSHMGFLMLGYILANRVAPIGNSSTMFVATGVLPYILFFYPARLMMISALIARPLLHFPVVKFAGHNDCTYLFGSGISNSSSDYFRRGFDVIGCRHHASSP